MRKNILLIVLLIFGYFVLAQNLQVPYGRLNAQGDGYDLHNFQTREVISDYGMRASDGTNFHRGIDYVPDGYLEDDAVLSIESGVITSIFEGAGAKRIVIAGDNNGHRFAYLHIFENGFPSTRGQFVMDYLPNTNTPVIIDLVNNRALSTVNNINFNYNGQNYTTTNHVTQNWPIAPIGNSGTMGAHLHLSLLESGNLPSSSTESIDPWNAVVNPDNALETRIRSRSQQNFALNECEANHPAPQPQTQHNWGGIQLDYANDTRNILEVEVAMTGAQTVDNTAAGLDQYTNTCMNEDRIDILIRNTAAGGNSTNIQGRHHHSRFVIDPEGANTTYPERMRDGIYGGTGAIESGCVPFAYRSNGADGFVLQNNDPVHAHDYYVFPDFYLRIHNTQITAPQPNNGLKMANLPWNAKYTDGEYQISSSVRNIEGDQYNLANPININMDNFWPFVRGANVYFNGNQKVYEAYYHANNNTDQCSDVKIFETPELSASNLPQNGPVHIFVETSEPVQTSGSGLISAQIWDPNGVAYAISSLQTDDGGIGQKWKMTFNGPIPYNSGGEYQFRFYHGWDNDNHPMLNFDAWGNTVVEPVPHRTGNNSWAPSAPNANQIGQSRLYKFTLNGTCAPHFANDTPSNNLSPSNDPCECDPVADFSFTPDSDGLTVDFDASTSSGTEPLTYSWTFGGDGDGTGIMPTHIFSEGGTYVVVLTVTNGCGTATATAEHNVTVNEGSPSSMWLTLSGPTLATECQQVSFNANVTGGVPPYTYAWNMGDEYCSPGCPTDCSVNPDFEGDQTESAVFTYTGLGTNSVCVTVTDAVGNSEYECLELKVKNGIQPLEIVINGTPACGSAYASNTLIVMWPDIDPLSAFEYPTDYFWDFGDGDTYFDNFDGGGVAIHSYDSLGDFTITLTVSDPNGSMQATKEISICGPGGGNPPTCDLVNSINPLSPTIVLDYVGNSGAPSSVYFDYTSNQVPLCMPTYKWTGRMDDCGLGYLFNDEDTLLGLPIGSGLNVDLTAENWWGIVTQFRKPWGCLRLQCVESGPYCETCTAPNPSNPCIAYILPDELLISQLAVQEDCPDYQLTAEVEKGAWKLVGSEYTYKEYQWTAFDIDDPSMEIDILVGADAKSPTINTGHPYFDKFTTARYPQFVVKLKVTDFANQINEAGDVISFNPFRLNLKTNYARCPETWSYFENLPLAFGGSGNYEFTWTTPNGPLDFESNDPQDPNPYFKTPASGSKTYDLLVNMLDGNGAVLCQLSKTIVVTASPLILDLPDVPWPICGASGREIGVFDFSNLGGSGNYGFEWTAADLNHLTYLSDVFSPHPIAKDIQPGQSITYTLTVGDLASQCTASDNLTITSVANNYTVALHGPETVCFGQAVTLMADASPIETDPPWGNVFNQYIWSSNNPHHELSGLGTHVSNLPIDGIVSSHPETYAYTIRYQNAITGCYAEATKSVTIREPWSHVGYVPKIKSAVAGTSQPLWENGINNYISSGADLSQIQVMWDPYPPPTKVYHVSNGNITQLPVNGTFIPTAEVPYLTMTVFDNLTGCSKSYKTIRYILIESNPEFSFLADNIIGCEGGSLCFDIVFDAHLVNYTTSLLPTQLSVKYRIRDPATNNIPIGPIIVDLNLQNNAGLYKGNVCIDLTGLTPNNPNFGYWFELFTNPSSHPIWGSVQLVANSFYLYEKYPSDQAPNLIECSYMFSTSRISIDLGVGCTSPSPQMWSGHLKAKEYIEIHPEGDIELIPQPGLNAGPTLVINPCISPQLESPDLEESVVPPITSDRSTDIQPKPINGEATFEIFPNPFTGEVSIKYSLPPDCEDEAQIKLLDITGKHLRLIDKKKSASGGQFEITFDGKYLPPGVYFYELATGNCRKIKKAVKIGF